RDELQQREQRRPAHVCSGSWWWVRVQGERDHLRRDPVNRAGIGGLRLLALMFAALGAGVGLTLLFQSSRVVPPPSSPAVQMAADGTSAPPAPHVSSDIEARVRALEARAAVTNEPVRDAQHAAPSNADSDPQSAEETERARMERLQARLDSEHDDPEWAPS